MKKTKRLSIILTVAIAAAVCFTAVFPLPAEAASSSGKLKTPSIKLLKKSDNGFVVISSKNSKAKGFQIKYSTSISFKNSKYKSAKGSKVVINVGGLKEYKRYYVRIRAYKMVKGKRKYSKWSKWKRVTTSCKPFDGYNAYTRYAQTTLYKSRTVLSSSITLWYNTKVYVAGVRKIAGVKWIRVYYKGKRYYIPASSLSQKLKKEGSQYAYFGKTELENEVLAAAMDVYLNWPNKYDYTHKAPIAVPNSSGVYPLDCSALVAYVLNSTMQKYCPAYNASKGVLDEYYTDNLVNNGFSDKEFKAVTVCTGKPVLSKLRAGDILFFRQSGGYPIDHVGIYLGNGEFMQSNGIYSRYPGDNNGGVNIAPLMKGVYYSYFKSAKRFIPQSPAGFKTLNKVLVRKTAVTVYKDLYCTAGNEQDILEVPDGAKEMEIPVLYTGNRYYNDDKVPYRCAYIEYEDESGGIAHGFVKITDKSVIRDPKPAEPQEDTSADQPAGQPANQPTDQPAETPTDQSTGQPAETPTDQASEQPTETPTDQPTSQPAETPTDQSTGQPAETPTDQSTSQPAETPTDQSTGQPTETPTDQSVVQP